MSSTPENAVPAQPQPPDYEERIAQQQAVVAEVVERYQKNPSPELKLEMRRKTDTLRHIQHLAKGKPNERARQAAEIAKKSALRKAFA